MEVPKHHYLQCHGSWWLRTELPERVPDGHSSEFQPERVQERVTRTAVLVARSGPVLVLILVGKKNHQNSRSGLVLVARSGFGFALVLEGDSTECEGRVATCLQPFAYICHCNAEHPCSV